MIRLKFSRALVLCAFCAGMSLHGFAQQPATPAIASNTDNTASSAASTGAKTDEANPEMEEMRRQLREQQEELKRMRETIEELRVRVDHSALPGVANAGEVAATDAVNGASQDTKDKGQTDTDARLGKVEEQVKKTSETIAKQLGSITFYGDLRFRYEGIFGQLNSALSTIDTTILGNRLSSRQRFRLRARFGMRGQIGKEFDWGIRLASGSFADTISANQTLTDFYSRKPFGLDQAFIAWSPKQVPGLRIQAGKFDVPWLRTELTIDNDVNPEGVNETYTRSFKDSMLKNITFVAWQLPFLERTSAFVLRANGSLDIDASRRGGHDLALYGAQLRARFEPSKKVGITLSAADLYYSGTEFISPAQVFGSLIQVPVVITIPATATTPAQTLLGAASIPRDQLVSGNANLGVSIANSNAVNRDGRLSSGYNLVDLIGRLDLNYSNKWPLAFIFNFVHNTQVHDVVLPGPGGTNRILPNNEDNGYWAELQVGRSKERGDWQFGYTFIRIEKDAVLTPFNFSDIEQRSDTRVHRFNISYAVDPRVLLALTTYINQRPNGLLGVFLPTPLGSLNGATTRVQFDTIFRF